MQSDCGPDQSVRRTFEKQGTTLIRHSRDYKKLHRQFYFSGEDKTSLTPKERYRLNLVLCAYWTCVQLES